MNAELDFNIEFFTSGLKRVGGECNERGVGQDAQCESLVAVLALESTL